MKKIIPLFLLLFVLILFSSCRNKTVILLTKKWDCVQVDNIVPPDTKSLTATDSLNLEKLNLSLQSMSLTFKKNMRYEFAIKEQVTVRGKYELLGDDRILILTRETVNFSTRYIIKTLTADELVLTGNAENQNVVLHFKPH
ncbi:MAG: hypothetical protein IPL54_02375 [Chitinophagaceae bacterium]|nr:hypothetical protein [Chitinophagaceae bacterium]